jgi:MoaA/NifB/PqqE/SkfB family radical SAM enzyme
MLVTHGPSTSESAQDHAPSSALASYADTKEVTASFNFSALGVDLSRYDWVEARPAFTPLTVPHRHRDVMVPVLKGMASQLLGLTPSPVMLTHIVTTRCNYSCGFCSFADTLNAKSNELSLDEIRQAYQTIGNNLNVVVYSGGETTLHKDLAGIIEAAYELTPMKSAYIISNAWKPDRLFEITHQVLQRCSDLHLTWSLSIEGPKAHNNATRYTKLPTWDAWQNTIDTLVGLKRIREKFGYTQLDAQLCTVCTPENYHLLDDWYHTIKTELKPDKWNLNLLRKSVQMTGHALASFDERRRSGQLEPFEQKYLEITQRVRQDVLSGDLQFVYHTDRPGDGKIKAAVDLVSQEANRNTLLQRPQGFGCKAGSFGAYIGSAGEVSGCEEFANNPSEAKVFGNLRDANYDFQAIWHNDAAKQYRKQVNCATECHGCSLESQRNYPAILMSPKSLLQAARLGQKIQT